MRIHKLASLVALGVLAATVPGAARLHQPEPPPPLFQPSALLRDGTLTTRALRSSNVSWHGGAVTARTGEHLTVYVSDSYSPTVNDVQQWADFVAGLIHGSELSLLTAYIATPAEVVSACDGADALGCYGSNSLIATGEAVDGESPQEVVRHEYGHHVAANRVNPPWQAIDWGTKRWATQVSVCPRSAAGSAFPGDEGSQYTLNPGEAFAETYRVLNDSQPGIAVNWPLVDPSFLPSPAALQAVRDDVVRPWTVPTASVVHGRFRATGRSVWSMPLAEPLDGMLSVDLSFPTGTHYDVVLADSAGKRVLAQGSPSGRASEKLTFLICGARSARLRVTRHGRPGPFALHITRP
jgi:hypothetical protein